MGRLLQRADACALLWVAAAPLGGDEREAAGGQLGRPLPPGARRTGGVKAARCGRGRRAGGIWGAKGRAAGGLRAHVVAARGLGE
eukprot:5098643-Prymnesium_polylepis.1